MDELQTEIINLIKNIEDSQELHDALSHYHDHDIAAVFEFLEKDDLKKLYKCFSTQELSDIISYIDDASEYLSDFNKEKAADLIELMDSDDAIEVLEDLDEKEREEIINLLDEDIRDDLELINSYDDDQIGSYMNNNYIYINRGVTVKQAMRIVIKEAESNDNFTIIYVVEDDEKLYGTIELKELIKARAGSDIEDIIKKSYPSILDTDPVSEALITIKDYEMDSIPVVDKNNKLLGVITSNDLVEVVDDELSDDYAKLAGFTSEEDLNEGLGISMKKRIPWLIILLILGLLISLIMSGFEAAIVAVPVIVFFQSMILDMGGNVGTQSLAVTIRAISDDKIPAKEVTRLIFKELRVAFFNGIVLSVVSYIVVLIYLLIAKEEGNIYLIAGIVSVSLLITMVVSGLVGSIVPVILKKCKVDPAVASGPFITTINDITAIVIYYGIASILLSFI